MNEFTLNYKFYAHSSNGKSIDKKYRTQQGFEDGNRKMLAEVLDLPSDEQFALNVDASTGETDVEGQDLFVYVRENDSMDNQLKSAIQFAIEDLKNPDSSLCKDLYSQFYSDNDKDHLVEFGMRIIDAILLDMGVGNGGNEDNDAIRVVAKVYEPYDNRILDYGNYLNYFSFDLEDGIVEEEIDKEDYFKDYMLDFTMGDINKEYILSHIVPAFYCSLTYLKAVTKRRRELFAYTFELA